MLHVIAIMVTSITQYTQVFSVFAL